MLDAQQNLNKNQYRTLST